MFDTWLLSMLWAWWHFNEHIGMTIDIGMLTIGPLSLLGYFVGYLVTKNNERYCYVCERLHKVDSDV